MNRLTSWLYRLWFGQMPKHNGECNRELLEELRHLWKEIKELKYIMATYAEALAAFITQQNTFNAATSAGIDAAVTSLDGLTGDVKNLNDQIAALQNSSGTVTAQDQTTIDNAQAAGQALQAKLTAFGTAIESLNALTPPVIPPVVAAGK
jgi:chromosome segregation ATPase